MTSDERSKFFYSSPVCFPGRAMRKIILTSLAVFALSLAAEGVAFACECPPPGVPVGKSRPQAMREALVEDLNAAFAVFAGEVVELDTFKVKFKVNRIWKGGFGEEVVMRTGAEKHGRGVSINGCDYSFELGGKYLVYAYGGSAAEMKAGVCSRTKELSQAEQEIKELDEISPRERRNRKPEAGSCLAKLSDCATGEGK
jgi:hypothetical protein